jgi:glycosyltransferase involved in cell wall biosynthesis
MLFCLDVQPAVSQSAGIGRYTRRLAEHLDPLCAGDERLRLFCFDFRGRAHLPRCPKAEIRAVRWCPGRLAQWSWKTLGWPPADAFAGRADLYHFTNFILPPLRHGRAVVTVHDASFIRHPEYAERRNLAYLRRRIGATVRGAAAILTLSRHAAAEIEELLPAARGKVFPVPLGVDAGFARPDAATIARTLTAFGLSKPYLLAVGTIEPRKNYAFLVDVFEQLTAFDGELVIAGMPGWQCEPIFRRLRSARRAERIRYLRFVPDEHLPALYAGSALLVYPSVYEGFGLPPLEAMACGAPVVSSCGGALRETLAGGARLIESYDVDAWVAELGGLLDDQAARASLAAAGRRHVAAFTWQRTAAATLNLYRTVVQA